MTARRGLRVLMTADPIGGVWTYALELIGALAEHHVDVVLATMGARLSAAQRHAVHRIPNAVLAESGLDIVAAADMADGAQKAVAAAKGAAK